MSLLKIEKHSDVLTALGLVKDEVGKESDRIHVAGGKALMIGKREPAKEAIAYAEALDAFVKKVKALEEEWKALEAKIDEATPEVKEIVLPSKPNKPHKIGFKRNVIEVGPKTKFTVKFPDGTLITAPKAKDVLAKTIEKIGASKVAALGFLPAGEPLVTKDKSQLQKQPHEIAEIKGGWFVKTHSSTQAKMTQVEQIAKALEIKLKVTLA
ncbi:MAG: hypothetical protein IJV69_00195 [Kiritimatiellae bacterium]|nr:hypothetical protein [Kiritimatiellia bacterium]